jgi:hypothetical protein
MEEIKLYTGKIITLYHYNLNGGFLYEEEINLDEYPGIALLYYLF